ncbi:hypothetical protein COO60DRAFT_1495436 [Scenedesmus sp. NREL 46B-D3]|nr:hypothetical protein COO60DRAFT_1495436 [Scenedesmus sp. NREL 46B-D3]
MRTGTTASCLSRAAGCAVCTAARAAAAAAARLATGSPCAACAEHLQLGTQLHRALQPGNNLQWADPHGRPDPAGPGQHGHCRATRSWPAAHHCSADVAHTVQLPSCGSCSAQLLCQRCVRPDGVPVRGVCCCWGPGCCAGCTAVSLGRPRLAGLPGGAAGCAAGCWCCGCRSGWCRWCSCSARRRPGRDH